MRPEIAMVSAAIALAIAFVAVSQRLWRRRESYRERAAETRSRAAVSRAIRFSIAQLGRGGVVAARRVVADCDAESAIDLTSWSEGYVRRHGAVAAAELLDESFRVAIATGTPIPAPQYAALLQLAFALGFHTDALTRLRQKYRVEIVDYSKNRDVSTTRLRSDASYDTILASQQLLGVSRPFGRRELAAAYKRAVAVVHPDRFHDADEATRDEAVAKFLDLARAYEQLLPYCEKD